MSDEEKKAAVAARKAKMAEKKAAFEAMSDEEKKALKAEKKAKKESKQESSSVDSAEQANN